MTHRHAPARRGARRLLASAGVAILALAAPARGDDAMRLDRITIASSGVAALDFLAEPEDGVIAIRAPLEQIDDILKSLVVSAGAARVDGASLAGLSPAADLFRGLPFGPDSLGSVPDLLRALRGAELKVEGPRELEGRIVAVDDQAMPGGTGEPVLRHRVTLAGEDGLVAFILEEVQSLRFEDDSLQRRLRDLLEGLARSVGREERELRLRVESDAGTKVRLGWIAEAPVWKAAWRLVLDGEGGRLQGWAVLENKSGFDWKGVQVTLVSGAATALRQELYRSYFAQRTTVPVLDEGPVFAAKAIQERGAPRAMAAAPMAAESAEDTASAAMPAPPALAVAAATEGVTATSFTLPTRLDVPDGHTLTAPLGETDIRVERIALVPVGSFGPNPDAAIRFVNATKSSLPRGILTITEAGAGGPTFLGDAVLPATGPSETRVVAFGRDLKTAVERQVLPGRRVGTVRVVDGVLEAEIVEREVTKVTATAPQGETRRLIVEVPRNDGWRLVAPEKAETAPGVWRIETPLAATETRTVEAVAEWPVQRRVELASADPREVELVFEGAELPDALRAKLGELRELNAAVDTAEQQVDGLESDRTRVIEEQSRTRENLAVAPQNSDLQRRLLARLDASETRIGEIEQRIAAAHAEVQRAGEAVAAFVRGLTF